MIQTAFHPRSISLTKELRLVLSLLLLLAMLSSWMVQSSVQSEMPGIAFGTLALSFVPNQGQTDPAVRFEVHDMGGSVYFTSSEAVLNLPGGGDSVHLSFENASPSVEVQGLGRQPGTVNYMIGSDPAAWRTALPTFAGIVYSQLYPGIDLHYVGTNGTLKGSYSVAPGVDPAQIRWRYSGVSRAVLDRAGNLVLSLGNEPGTRLVEHAPAAWQEIHGKEVPVSADYVKHADGSFGFALGAYDASLALVIDPTLTYGAVLGGSQMDMAEGMVVDGQGYVYVTGSTLSTDFPTKKPLYDAKKGEADSEDAFILKLTPAGDSLVYGTFLGGSSDDAANDIAVDSSGNIYTTGDTHSNNFPTANAYQSQAHFFTAEAFVVKLNAEGNQLLYGTYLGGDLDDMGEGIAVEEGGKAYITGVTFSGNFPTKNALQSKMSGENDAFVVKLDTTQSGASSLAFSTYLGGQALDGGARVALDGGGLYVAGHTLSDDFPREKPYQAARAGQSDVFLVKMNGSGSDLLFSTFLGGGENDYAYDLAVDGSGNAYITGQTLSTDFPTRAAFRGSGGGKEDAFLAKISSSGSDLVYSTYLGGSETDFGYGVAVNSKGEAYVTGSTRSANFPTEKPVQSYMGEEDAFVLKLSEAGDSLQYSTFLGGSKTDSGAAIAVDQDGNAFVAGITISSDFPSLQTLQEKSLSDFELPDTDVFVVKINDAGSTPPKPGPNLAGSSKSASQFALGTDGELTFTINLYNSGTEATLAEVSDVLDPKVRYVAGSVTGGGSYQEGTRTLSWTGVKVPAGEGVSLSYRVKQTEPVTSLTEVVNTATITAYGQKFERNAWIVLVPNICPRLLGSYKIASKGSLAPDEKLTYTIWLYNNGTSAATVDVIDALPPELRYIAGSADHGGSYDASTRKVSWTGLSVRTGDELSLTFQVEPALEVAWPKPVMNTAKISSNGETLERKALVVLVPEPLPGDFTPPTVDKVTIGNKDVLTSRDVKLHITASEDAETMYVREWHLVSAPVPHWEEAQSSGWVPFSSEYPWTLTDRSGTHYIGVWTADSAKNKSLLGPRSMDYASLVLPGATVPKYSVVAYMVHYAEGVDVTAQLTPTGGDADLYVWYPGNPLKPDQKSTANDSSVDSVSFKTPRSGTYLFLVHGYTGATYDLSITPAGGPESWLVAEQVLNTTFNATAAEKQDELTSEPVLSKSGLDPLGTVGAEAPVGPDKFKMFIPFLRR